MVELLVLLPFAVLVLVSILVLVLAFLALLLFLLLLVMTGVRVDPGVDLLVPVRARVVTEDAFLPLDNKLVPLLPLLGPVPLPLRLLLLLDDFMMELLVELLGARPLTSPLSAE